LGLRPLFSGGGTFPSNTKSPEPRPTSIPSGILIYAAIWPQRIWPKIGACPPMGEGELGPHLTMWPMWPTCRPSFILIRQTVWPQYTNITDRQTDNGPIAQGEPFYKRSPKNRKIAISRQRLYLSPQTLTCWRIPIAVTSMQPICSITNFLTDSLQHVRCCTSVIFLFFTKFLRNTNMSHLFTIMLPNNCHITIAKLWSVYRHLFILGSFKNLAPVVALVDCFMRLMSHVYFQKHSLYRMTR